TVAAAVLLDREMVKVKWPAFSYTDAGFGEIEYVTTSLLTMVKLSVARYVLIGSVEFCWTMKRNTSLPEVSPKSLIVTVTCAVLWPTEKLTTWFRMPT